MKNGAAHRMALSHYNNHVTVRRQKLVRGGARWASLGDITLSPSEVALLRELLGGDKN